MIEVYSFCKTDYFCANCYLIGIGGEYAVIDPSVDCKEVLKVHPEIQGKIKYILLTHCHFDHIYKINTWTDECKNVIVGSEDAKALSDPFLNCYLGFRGYNDGYFGQYKTVNDKDVLVLGGIPIVVIGCPGHTPGGVSYQIENKVFCGDTVFAEGGYGRCDLPGGNIDALEKTLMKLISILPSECVLYPGHGPSTTFYEIIHYLSSEA